MIYIDIQKLKQGFEIEINSISIKQMGQQNAMSYTGIKDIKELQLIDEQKQIYLNTSNKKKYTKHYFMLILMEDAEHEKDIFLFRRLNQKYLVCADYYTSTEKPEYCAQSSQLSYYIEAPEKRLFDLHQMSLKDGLLKLIACLHGFSLLYEKFGYFAVNSRMIMFNTLNETKVWMNENLTISKNVQNENSSKSKKLEDILIRQMVHLFDCIRDCQIPQMRYSDFINKNRWMLSFEEAIQVYEKAFEGVKQFPKEGQAFQKKTFHQFTNQVHNPNHVLLASIKEPQLRERLSPRYSFGRGPQHFVKSFTRPVQSPRNQRPQFFNPNLCSTKENIQNHQLSNEHQIKQLIRHSLKSYHPEPQQEINKINHKSPYVVSTMPNSENCSKIFLSEQFSKKTGNKKCGEVNGFAGQCQLNNRPSIRFRSNDDDDNKFVLLGNKSSQIRRYCSNTNSPCKESRVNIKISDLEEERIRNHFDLRQFEKENNQKKNYQKHRRNQTDINAFDQPLSHQPSIGFFQSNMMQKPSVECSQIEKSYKTEMKNVGRLNLVTTIKSIHLLESGKELEHEIIYDLRNIINKYKGNRDSIITEE